jgi:NAD(P)-dependent dehydrogenase (short-subunit alcohol dehydrogenase family)
MNHYQKRIRFIRCFSGAWAMLLLMIATLPFPAAAETVMVTGSNRGIGLEFVKQYATRGWTVIATHRRDMPPQSLVEVSQAHPGQITIEQMDVADHGQIMALAQKLKAVPIDLIINNAALTSDFENLTRHSFGTLDHSQFDRWMAVNAHGPLMVSEAFIENVKASEQKKIVSLTSLLSSFERNLGRPGSFYWDKASKVALNAIMLNLSYDLKDDGVIVALVSPGIVRVEKTQHLPRRPNQIDTHVSVAGLIKVIDELTMEKTGSFTRYNGNPVPF